METGRIRIGTRGSALALRQVELVSEALKAKVPELEIEIEIITTKGDINQSPIPLDSVGKSWFTGEIEDALLAKRIDLAIHSLKDLPLEIPEGLVVLPVLVREDARDVLVSADNLPLEKLPEHAVVGTDSTRRKAQLLAVRPDLIVQSVRGNVETRIKKLRDGQYDALVLAAAGLTRLGLDDAITEYFDAEKFVPASGQGVLAAECAADDAELLELLAAIQDPDTVAAVAAEKAFSDVVGSGCKLPIGCYAAMESNGIVVHGMIGNEDGTNVVHGSKRGRQEEGVTLSQELAHELQRRFEA